MPAPLPAEPQDGTRPGAHVVIEGLTKAFGASPVLSGIDLEIAPGECVAIIGRSGCGKSTLLRQIAGLDAPGTGRLLIDGHPPLAGDDRTRIMFQEPRLLPWARVGANVAVGAPAAMPSLARDRAVRQALAAVELAERADAWPAELSGGQRQRVALARALLSRPRLLLLDEPLGALDALTRITMQALILRMARAQGFSTLLVTHDVAEAVAMADRVILLEAGRIAHVAEIDQPHPRPRGDAGLAAIEGALVARILDGAPARNGEMRRCG